MRPAKKLPGSSSRSCQFQKMVSIARDDNSLFPLSKSKRVVICDRAGQKIAQTLVSWRQ